MFHERDAEMEKMRNDMETYLEKVNSVENHVKRKTISMIEEIQSNHKIEIEKIDKHEAHFNCVTGLKKKIDMI